MGNGDRGSMALKQLYTLTILDMPTQKQFYFIRNLTNINAGVGSVNPQYDAINDTTNTYTVSMV